MTINFTAVLDWLLLIAAGVGICLSIYFQLLFLRRQARGAGADVGEESKATPAVTLTLVSPPSDCSTPTRRSR